MQLIRWDLPEAEFGKWKIFKFTVNKDQSMMTSLRAMRDGRGYVPEGTYTKLYCAGRGTIMSDTPDEMRDHYGAVRNAKGHVLINGLGIGMVL